MSVFFGKKNIPKDITKEDSSEGYDKLGNSGDSGGEGAGRDGSSREGSGKEGSGKDGSFTGEALRLEMERLRARLDAASEQGKALGERLSAMAEQVTELRTQGYEREKKIDMIEAKSAKAIGLVEEIEPQKIIEITQENDARMQQLSEKITSGKIMTDSIMDELKGLRKEMKVFKNVEEIMLLAGEIKDDIIYINKAKSVVELQASKVEGMYLEMHKNSALLHKMGTMVEEAKRAGETAMKESMASKARFSDMASRKELFDLKDTVLGHEHDITSLLRSRAASALTREEKELIVSLSKKVELHEREIGESQAFMERMLSGLRDISRQIAERRHEDKRLGEGLHANSAQFHNSQLHNSQPHNSQLHNSQLRSLSSNSMQHALNETQQALAAYVREMLLGGAEPGQVKSRLYKMGWDNGSVDIAFRQAGEHR